MEDERQSSKEAGENACAIWLNASLERIGVIKQTVQLFNVLLDGRSFIGEWERGGHVMNLFVYRRNGSSAALGMKQEITDMLRPPHDLET